MKEFYRVHEVIGQDEITPEQAEANRRANLEAAENARRQGKDPKKVWKLPVTPRPATDPLIPISHAHLYRQIKSGRLKAVKVGGVTLITGASIQALLG